jgi:hypothetical protein
MISLDRRLSALEAQGAGDLSHLTDEQLTERMIKICEELEAAGGPMPIGWRDAIARKDLSFTSFWKQDLKEAQCQPYRGG